uniref:Uncharacterized protein n=1 Tax=Avena sativa TaxID=4498 RepID=A0ACD5Y4W9_AVESA
MITNSGKEWLLQLLSKIPKVQRAMTLMILWRNWHVHNEITHDKPMPPVEGSKRFLASYLDSLLLIRQKPYDDSAKGKSVVVHEQGFTCAIDGRQKNVIKWSPPPTGMVKLNTDGSYVNSQEAGTGMVLRDENRTVILAATRKLRTCTDATASGY